ncbi:efflux RND transporter periplasmic adaptor subunit [Bythopirellula goksoeyrii]|uniref:Cobalt-zinc-cadmium resistance protein CzcB n=1 Tax=Bythopirellula goksoeyrii TaxID=1400387 RepID=A0A5B9QAE3_9BACT|nr:efflux RND transporter periplasmic adaptor subunit [Bythopirellula goksoeyrii]QEG35858.1 Cobalt-zinc-cadmium resistance protein CzcB [Bythopirellula goksoeyrii]
MNKHFPLKAIALAIFTLVQLALVNAEPHGDHEAHATDDKHEESSGKNEESDDGHDHGESSGDEGHNENFVELSPDRAKKAGLQIVSAGPAQLQDSLKLYGETTINSNNIIHVVPRFAGTIQKVNKELGSPVKAGELLATIQSNESLSPYDIKAELDGVVISKDATRGEFVNEESEIFVIASLKDIWVNVAIFPKDLKRVRVGTSVRVTSKAINLMQLGEIGYIRPTLTEATRTALARIELDNESFNWLPGMFVEVEALLDSENVSLAVPNSSILLVENKQSVFVNGKSEDGELGFEVRHVQVGRTDGTTSEILSGLKAGDKIAAGRTFILKAELGKGAAEHSH